MANRSVSEIMAEGQKLTLEWAELKRKKIGGAISTEESTRLIELDGYLLGLMETAQAMGVGVPAPIELGDEDIFVGDDQLELFPETEMDEDDEPLELYTPPYPW